MTAAGLECRMDIYVERLSLEFQWPARHNHFDYPLAVMNYYCAHFDSVMPTRHCAVSADRNSNHFIAGIELFLCSRSHSSRISISCVPSRFFRESVISGGMFFLYKDISLTAQVCKTAQETVANVYYLSYFLSYFALSILIYRQMNVGSCRLIFEILITTIFDFLSVTD